MKKASVFLLSLLVAANLFAQEQNFSLNLWVVDQSVSIDESNANNLPENIQSFTFFESFTNGVKTVAVTDCVSFDSSEIGKFVLDYDFFGRDCVNINFNKSGTQKLADFTSKNIGNQILMEINGIVLVNAKLTSAITAGNLQLDVAGTRNPLYNLIQLPNCRNTINLSFPEKLIYAKNGNTYSFYKQQDNANLTQAGANFFYYVFAKSDDSYAEYVLPESQETISRYVEIFRSDYENCTIQLEEVKSLSWLVLQRCKKDSLEIPLFFKVDNGTYSFCEEIIFVVDKSGKLKIKRMTFR